MTKKYRAAAQVAGVLFTGVPGARQHRLALAALLAVGGMVFGGDASALALGRMTVQSSLGEPLRAEIEVPEITDLEADTLVVQPASAAAFRAAGVEYGAAIAGLQLNLVRRADGRSVVRVIGNRPVNDPFVEMLLEANWAGGRISRNYTVLLDPPSNRASAAAAPQIAPQIAAAAPVAERPPAAPRAPAVTAEPRQPSGASQVTVRPGDTAGRLAAAYKPASVSLDQMLVALLQANPDAFVGSNVNRMRAGAVLDVPDAAQIAATPAPQAHQIVVAQSRDFNEFRRRLASRAPAADVGTPQRAATGSVQTQVEDRRTAAAPPDRLTLSKGATGTEADRVAQAGNSRDAAARTAELSKNLNDLNKLGNASAPAATPGAPAITASTIPAAAPTPAATAPAVETPAPAVTATATAPAADTPPPESASGAPAATAPTPAPAAPPAPAVPPAPAPAAAVPQEDGLGSLLEDSRVLAVVGLLVALIVALASYRIIRRRRSVQDSNLLESRMQQDSFFGNSGGQHVNTRSTQSVIATSYSPSQLDAGGDVDPLAEADVYLAYGRDLQAEEILREALRLHPERTALHAKLAEIYARRPDAAAFHAIAADAHRVTGGLGDDWRRIRTLGQELDPSHALYQAQPTMAGALVPSPAVAAAAAGVAAATAAAALADAARAPAEPTAAPVVAAPKPVLDTPKPAATPVMPSLDLDFSEFPSPPPPPATPAAAAPADDDFGLDFTLDDNASAPAPAGTAPAAPAPAPAAVDFDLDSLSLDLDTPASALPVPADITGSVPSPEDALATKLALAEEFAAIGDADGARHLVEEVIAEAKGSLRTRAEGMLAKLD